VGCSPAEPTSSSDLQHKITKNEKINRRTLAYQHRRASVKTMFKVIVAGGRDFTDYKLQDTTLQHLLSQKSDIEIVSGMAQGADTLALTYAFVHKLPVRKFPADWDKHGNPAGYIRNLEMAKYADACACFWDGKSKGTADMIRVARYYKLPVRVIRY